MNNKKKIIEESFNKMKSLLESRLSEASMVQPAQPGQQAQQLGQQPRQQAQQPGQQPKNPQRDKEISKNIDVTMDQAITQVVKGLPAVLDKFVKSSGDKDGALDAPGVYDNNAQPKNTIQEGAVNEVVFDESKFMEAFGEQELDESAFISSFMAAPAILKYGGQFAKWTGNKMNSKWLQKWGGKTAEAGEKLHHKYIQGIEKIIARFMPNASQEQIHKAANVIFMGAVGIAFADGLSHPGIFLNGVKGAELGEFALSKIGNILPKIGFS